MGKEIKIFIIGSNSFSGASFCAYALENGAQVCGVSRSLEPNSVFLPYSWTKYSRIFSFTNSISITIWTKYWPRYSHLNQTTL